MRETQLYGLVAWEARCKDLQEGKREFQGLGFANKLCKGGT